MLSKSGFISARVLAVWVRSRKPQLLRMALLGVVISGIVVGLGAHSHLGNVRSMRLGIIYSGDMAIGNPFALGAPLALGLLLIILDRGRWLGLQNRKMIRYVLIGASAVLLALTASRTAWFILIGGIFLGIFLGGKQRWRISGLVVLVILGGTILINSELGQPFRAGWERTFGEERSLEQASSGRTRHWVVFKHAITKNPSVFFFGYGGGTNEEQDIMDEVASELYGLGDRHVFHGFFLHIGMQFGMLGIALVTMGFLYVLKYAKNTLKTFGLVLPVAGAFALLCISLTGNIFDTISGTFLGLALIRPMKFVIHPPIRQSITK